jgi:hypothetical protein
MRRGRVNKIVPAPALLVRRRGGLFKATVEGNVKSETPTWQPALTFR